MSDRDEDDESDDEVCWLTMHTSSVTDSLPGRWHKTQAGGC